MALDLLMVKSYCRPYVQQTIYGYLFMAINFHDSPIPRYLQLADLMRQRIARAVWEQGQKVPSLDELVAEFGVARVTVRQAVDVLTRAGLVRSEERRVGEESVSTGRSRWTPSHYNTKSNIRKRYEID